MASSAINQDIHEVCQAAEQAEAALNLERWDDAERALLEMQDRIGRLLREVAMRRSGIDAPPPPIKGD